MTEPANNSVGSRTDSSCGHSVKIDLFNFRVNSCSLAHIFILPLFDEKLRVKGGRIDVKWRMRSTFKLFLQKEIVNSDAVVMPVILNVSSWLINILIVVWELFKDGFINWDWVVPYFYAQTLGNWSFIERTEPSVSSYFSYFQSSLGICCQETMQKLTG